MNYAAVNIGATSILPPAAGSMMTGVAMGSGWMIMTGAALMTVSLVTLSFTKLIRGERHLRAVEARVTALKEPDGR